MTQQQVVPLSRRTTTAPVIGVPAQPSTPEFELHAAKILGAMQRHKDTEWISAREIRGSRVRSTWATRDTVLAALDHLIACGLVQEGKDVDQFNTTRTRYRLTTAGVSAYIHPSRLAKVRKRTNVSFQERLDAAQLLCPPGYTICLVPTSALIVAVPGCLPIPTEPPAF